MTPSQKAWTKLISLVIGESCAAGTVAYAGGAKWPFALIVGIGTGCMSVYHSLSDSPQDANKP